MHFPGEREDRCISLVKETNKYETLIALKNVIIKGWPNKRDECLINLRNFWHYKDELSILDGFGVERHQNSHPKTIPRQSVRETSRG